MAPIDITQQYYTYEGRLTSFQTAQALSKRRASNASSKAPKAVRWPHSFLSPEEMAKAGFFHYPTQDNPDNTTCFLCRKSLDGWEENDDPLLEHLKHSPECGWAIVASIDARHHELSREYPLSTRMIEARKATFGDRWPHEDKKGWKCKTKQLVEAGWKYTPTPDYDDMATCAYCELALDGWEPSDKPLDEHQKRSPDCAFFSLIKSYDETNAPKKAAKGRKPRASKASRLSTQSTFTVVSEAPSIIDISADLDDSIVTTATNATATSQAAKKMPKAKKSTRGRKTKINNEETVEVSTLPEAEDADFEVKVPEPKGRKGKKRTSDAMEDGSALMDIQQPPAKRRGTRNMRGSIMVGESMIDALPVENADVTMTSTDESNKQNPEPKRKRGRPSAAKSKRNFSTASTASKASLRVEVQNDDEIEKALEADLERPLTDEEDNKSKAEPSKSRRESRVEKSLAGASAAPIRKTSRNSKVPNKDYDMFAVGNISVDEIAIEAELEAMEFEPIILPKAKGTKAKQPRKASAKQQAAAKRAEEAAQVAANLEVNVSARAEEPAPDSDIIESGGQPALKTGKGRNTGNVASSQSRAIRSNRALETSANAIELSTVSGPNDVDNSGNETDASITSQSTVIKGGAKRRGSNLKTKGGKKGLAQNIEEIVNQPAEVFHMEQEKEEAPKRKPVGRSKKATQPEEESAKEEVNNPMSSVLEQPPMPEPVIKPAKGRAAKGKGKTKALSKLPIEAEKDASEKQVDPVPESPKRPPKELTPSLSPQSSDAENLPPSSRPSTNKPAMQQEQTSRVPLAPGTPTMSPSKRNMVAGLQSTYPWAAVDLDDILLKSPSDVQAEKENRATNLLGEVIGNVKKGCLTSPEKKMTVEEWILFNASLAEEKLRGECERMVGVFEKEGGRAMRVLEGLDTVD